jgi:hypothetical protein
VIVPGQRVALPHVTLLAVSSVALAATQRALVRSMDQVDFGRVLLLSDQRPSALADGIEWQAIAPLRSRGAYSQFMLHGLADHVETDFALVVQWDGYVIDASAWQHAFLDFDYIGAPWPWHGDGHDVGNGGFSLRSQRLLRATRTLPATTEAEDNAICRTHRHRLENSHAISFAPRALAAGFAHERGPPPPACFGFHGLFNLWHHMPPAELHALLAGLEPGVIARREAGELFAHAVATADPRLALTAMRHRLIHFGR